MACETYSPFWVLTEPLISAAERTDAPRAATRDERMRLRLDRWSDMTWESFLEDEALTEEGSGLRRRCAPDDAGATWLDERPWPSSARSLVVDIADFARGRFPGSRVFTASLSLPRALWARVTRTNREATLRLQWRDRAGIRPASLLPSFYGGTLSDGTEDSSGPAGIRARKKERPHFPGARDDRRGAGLATSGPVRSSKGFFRQTTVSGRRRWPERGRPFSAGSAPHGR